MIDGTKNIPGTMPTASTWMFANNIYNYLSNLVVDGALNVNMEDEIIASSLVSRDGELVHAGASKQWVWQSSRRIGYRVAIGADRSVHSVERCGIQGHLGRASLLHTP